MPKLVLFDIDETMLASHGAGRRAIEKALSVVFDCAISCEGYSFSGKTDPQICLEIMQLHNIDQSAVQARLLDVYAHYIPELEKEVSQSLKFQVLSGVVELLDSLLAMPETHIALLTGNIEAGARVKLERPKLNRYFSFGAFGSDSGNRMDLPSVAHKRANELLGCEFAVSDIVIIGDAVNDVLCAKGYGARSIAVCTGKTKRDALEPLGPDYLLDSLADTHQVIQAILAN